MRELLDNYVISTIRTVVPTFVSTLLFQLTAQGFNFAEVDSSSLTSFLIALTVGTYYLVVRVLAARFPSLEWLLGYGKKPEYK